MPGLKTLEILIQEVWDGAKAFAYLISFITDADIHQKKWNLPPRALSSQTHWPLSFQKPLEQTDKGDGVVEEAGDMGLEDKHIHKTARHTLRKISTLIFSRNVPSTQVPGSIGTPKME